MTGVVPSVAAARPGPRRIAAAELPPRVALLAPNGPAWIAARDAVTVAGEMLVPLNPRLAPPEIAELLARARPHRVLADPALADRLPTGVAWEPVDRVRPAREPLRHEIGATLLFTSGTTGRPKACVRGAACERARAEELIATYAIGPRDVHLVACPLSHSAPGIFLRAARAAGAETVVLPRFSAESFLAAVERHRATLFFLVPTQIERLLALPASVRDRYDLTSVRCAIVAGAPFPPARKRAAIDWLGHGRLWEFYGSTETGTVAVCRPEEHLERPGSVGRPPPDVQIRTIDGELYVRSPAVMDGYLEDEPAVVDGYVTVGDLGRVDGDGYVHLVDRKHDTIITGGVNVYPAEVERALAELPGVRGAVVCGIDDPDWGQIVAAVVCADGSEDELRAQLRARIAPYKIPKRIAFVDAEALPVGSSGKPLRRRARDWFARGARR